MKQSHYLPCPLCLLLIGPPPIVDQAPGFLMLERRETARNGKQTRNLYNLLKIRNNSIIYIK